MVVIVGFKVDQINEVLGIVIRLRRNHRADDGWLNATRREVVPAPDVAPTHTNRQTHPPADLGFQRYVMAGWHTAACGRK
jgi:hypothetical protein